MSFQAQSETEFYVYSEFDSPRLRYVLDLVLCRLLGIRYSLTGQPDQALIIYGTGPCPDDRISIPCCSRLLSDRGIAPFQVPYEGNGAGTMLFMDSERSGKDWQFDLFSAVFYLCSRYEEYGGFEPDLHQRFPPEASILYKTQSLEYPLVNLWAQKLKQEIRIKFPSVVIKEPEFRFISTIDVDSTFQFREKGWLWSIKGMLRDALQGKPQWVWDRIATLCGFKKDAFDVFDDLHRLHQQYGTEVLFFFLLGDYGAFDKNIAWDNKAQKDRIQSLSKHYRLGIHPSYQSNEHPETVAEECRRFQVLTGKTPVISRQHYLKHKFPDTCLNLIRNGITEDYTLGYTSQYGFRAGIASPFYFYNLITEETTGLLLYPFCSMDITPLHYKKMSPGEAIRQNMVLLNRVAAVNGTFVSLWHNESISGALRWKNGWPEVYRQLIRDAAALKKDKGKKSTG